MQTATATVVDMKLSPVVSAPIVKASGITAQYLAGQFEEFSLSSAVAGYSMRDILAATARAALQAEVKELSLACTGLIEGTREKGEDDKLADGPRTAAARKFASWIKSVYGAIRFAGMSTLELDGYPSAEAIYSASVAYRKAAGNIDWKGTDEATKEQGKAKKATAKAVAEALEDEGKDVVDVLTLTPDEFKKVKAAADEKLKAKAAKDRVAAIEAKGDKLAKALIKEFGSIDDALAVIERARVAVELAAVGAV